VSKRGHIAWLRGRLEPKRSQSLGDVMFTLLKVVVEGILTLLVFFGGMKFQQHYPNFIARVDSILAWIKNILPGTTKS
jgi:hypothetical protein